jgi:prophage maintenance system killer protein
LARPQGGYYGDLIQEAAALWESLSQNHPFLDGNKRTAVTVTAAFLKGEWLSSRIRRSTGVRFSHESL